MVRAHPTVPRQNISNFSKLRKWRSSAGVIEPDAASQFSPDYRCVSMDDAANRIVDHYERHAVSWDADRCAAGWSDQPFIERFLSFLPQGATVLDLGCGGGSPVALHMVAQGIRVTGVDISPTLMSLCQTRMPDQEWIVRDMRSLAVEPQQVVLGLTEFADWCLRFYSAVRAMPIVSVQPNRKFLGATIGCGVGLSIGPLPE